MTLPVLSRVGLAVRAALDTWSGGSTSLVAWDAAKAGSRLSRWTPPSTDFATMLTPALVKARARDAHRNNCWARRAVDVLADSVVGTGIKPQAGIEDAALRARVHALWTSWTDSSDFSGRYDFYGQQAQALKAAAVDGEALCVIRPGNPLQLQILSSEYLDTSRDNAQNIAGGIEYNAAGQRVAYWLFQRHPAQALNPVSVRVPAEQVIHLFAPLQPGFERGVSWLAPALVPLYELQTYTEAALVRARTGSLFCGFVRSADGSDVLKSQESAAPAFEPGSMARLRPGDELQFTDPPDVGQSFDGFIKSQLRGVASALNLPYELLSGDYSMVTFASGRAGLLAHRRHCEGLAHHLVVFGLCRPTWAWWTRLMVAMGELPEAVLAAPVRWVGQPVEMLDARMEVESTVRRIRAGLLSRSEAVSQTGLDPEALDAEIARDNARADRMGLVYDSDPRRVSQQGQEQQPGGTDANVN